MIRLTFFAILFGLLSSCTSAPVRDREEVAPHDDRERLYEILNSRDNLADMAQCFRDEIDKGIQLPRVLQIYVLFDLDEAGQPENFEFGRASEYPRLENCLSARIAGLRFEGIQSRTSVKYPITYRRQLSSAFSESAADIAI